MSVELPSISKHREELKILDEREYFLTNVECFEIERSPPYECSSTLRVNQGESLPNLFYFFLRFPN